jgi:ADP-ribose pyrophosphatase
VIELPAGLVGDEPGTEAESFETAARRELLEETGYEAANWRLLCTGVSSPGMTDEAITYYLATGLTKVGEPVGDGHEDITVHVVPRRELLTFLKMKQDEGAMIDLKMFAPLVYLESEHK